MLHGAIRRHSTIVTSGMVSRHSSVLSITQLAESSTSRW